MVEGVSPSFPRRRCKRRDCEEGHEALRLALRIEAVAHHREVAADDVRDAPRLGQHPAVDVEAVVLDQQGLQVAHAVGGGPQEGVIVEVGPRGAADDDRDVGGDGERLAVRGHGARERPQRLDRVEARAGPAHRLRLRRHHGAAGQRQRRRVGVADDGGAVSTPRSVAAITEPRSGAAAPPAEPCQRKVAACCEVLPTMIEPVGEAPKASPTSAD